MIVILLTKEKDVLKVYNTNKTDHPGVKKELSRYKYRIGGKINILENSLIKKSLDQKKQKSFLGKKDGKQLQVFSNKKSIHKGHEYLQRVALDICDAIFINPLTGWKKKGDFSEKAVSVGYETMIKKYYKGLNIYFDTLKTPMRYAGPREAIFHAIIRRNLGCTFYYRKRSCGSG